MYHLQTLEDQSAHAILVLKPYAVRVRDALLLRTTTHLDITHDFDEGQTTGSPLKRQKKDLDLCTEFDIENLCTAVWDQDVKGVRKSRRGYSLLIIWNAKMSPGDLHAMCRQQISWSARLSHRMTFGDSADGCNITDAVFLETMTRTVMKEILLRQNFCNKSHKLRLDIHPKDLNESVCASFQKTAREFFPQTSESIASCDPFVGPLNLTKSISHANFVISIVLFNSSEFAFGISNIDDHWTALNGKLNHHAASDVIIEPTNPKDGTDLKHSLVPPPKNVPVSRAYYKLKQVHDEVLKKLSPHFRSSGASGLDIGAAPGGWSQVLYDSFGLQNVISVDPAILAQRVAPFVRHIKADFTSSLSVNELASNAPFSIVVCDACSNSNEIFSRIVNTFQNVHEKMKEKEDAPSVLTVPSTIVVTFKLPHKTQLSIERNLKNDIEKLPLQIQRMSKFIPATEHSFQSNIKVLHLLANSESERTVVITFENKLKSSR